MKALVLFYYVISAEIYVCYLVERPLCLRSDIWDSTTNENCLFILIA